MKSAKIIVIIVIMALSLLISYDQIITLKMAFVSSAIAFILGLLFASLSVFNSLRSNIELKKPSWNQSLFESPLVFVQFIGYLFISVGIVLFLGTMIRVQMINGIAITLISAGLSCLIGLYIILIRNKTARLTIGDNLTNQNKYV